VNCAYEELAPPAALSPWVTAFWQLRAAPGDDAPKTQRVLPDGSVDILFDFAQWRTDGGKVGVPARAGRLIGTMTRALVVPTSGVADLFGIRFRPGVIGSLTACPGRTVQDLSVSLSDVGIHLSVSDDELHSESSLVNRVRRVSPALLRLLGDRPTRDLTVLAAIAAWETAAREEFTTLPSVSDVGCRVGATERSLERRFSAWVGYRPAQFRRLVRFRAALKGSDAGRRSWAEVAARCGYSDQAHLSRDFSEFALTTASAWAAEQQPVGFLQDSRVASR
jgi:AraC-like DNA-binding protein